MKVLYLKSKDIKGKEKIKLDKNIEHIESRLYKYDNNKLLKIFLSTDQDFLMNKLYILNRLFYIKDHTNVNEIVYPHDLVKIGGNTKGYTMEYISDNTNAKTILNSNKIPIEDQLTILKKIYKVLEKIEKNDVLTDLDFHLGDIHEANFILNNKTKEINVVDIDSSYLGGAFAPISKYLTYNDKLWDFDNKYPLDSNDIHIPNKNTTILSYIYLLLNYITGDYVPDSNISEFCNYLNMLCDSGFDKELCDSIFNIYNPKNNYFDYNYLETITPKKILKFREIKNAKK